MFKFLKDKLKQAVSAFSKEVKEEVVEISSPEPVVESSPVESVEIVQQSKKPKSVKSSSKQTPSSKKSDSVMVEPFTQPELEQSVESVDDSLHASELASEIVLDVEEPLEELVEESVAEPAEEVTGEIDVLEPVDEVLEDVDSSLMNEVEDVVAPQEIIEELESSPAEAVIEVSEKKSFFSKLKETITTKSISEDKFEELFWDLELVLLENNVAVSVIEKIKQDLKDAVVNTKVKRSDIEDAIVIALKKSIYDLLDVESVDLLSNIKHKKPYVISFVGVNGAGKTTTIGKVAYYLQQKGFSVVMAAGDTFRAAAIQQLEHHANALNVKLIKQDYGSDSAAVAYDAISHAKAKGIDVVLIDTAGRLHSNTNLMDELKKVKRVANPDLTLFVGESITGNDCVEQAEQFNEQIGIDAIILSKADVDEKGGAAISVSYVTQKPILFLGMGQEYKDLKEFNPAYILDSLEL